MPSPLEIPWERLRLEDVVAFVSSVSGEGLTWEAKGTAPLSEQNWKIRQAACGLANQLGGVLLLGVRRAGDEWIVDGIECDVRADPHDWICGQINGGLNNPPPYAVRVFPLEGGRLVAAIRIDATPVPPCLTADGQVWVRVVEETVRVKDPAVLRDLITRGAAARQAAESRALLLCEELSRARPLNGTPLGEHRIVVALAPVASAPDIASRLFTDDFRSSLAGVAGSLPATPYQTEVPVTVEQRRDALVARKGSFSGLDGFAWGVRAGWDGSVAVEYAKPSGVTNRFEPSEVVAIGWARATELLTPLAGLASVDNVPVHVAVSVLGTDFVVAGREMGTGSAPLQRWAGTAAPNESDIASVTRELRRGAGIYTTEPTSD